MITALLALAIVSESDRLVLDGAFDIPVVAGTQLHSQCLDSPVFETLRENGANAVCVRYRMEDDTGDPDFDGQYVIALQEAGWRFAGGAANVFFFDRIIDDGCIHRLNMIGWVDGAPEEVAKIGTGNEADINWSRIPYGLFVFSLDDDYACTAE